MYQKKTKTVAGAESSAAMGAETIQKTRASLKSHKSKGYFMMLMALACALCLGFASCGDDDELEKIGFSASSYIISNGESLQLKVVPSPSGADLPAILWSSADPTIASVSDEGLVMGKSIGEVKITAKTADGEYVAECKVYVKLVREPLLTYEATKEQVKAFETRVLYEEIEARVSFKGENADVNSINYVFSENKLGGIGVVFNQTSGVYGKIRDFLEDSGFSYYASTSSGVDYYEDVARKIVPYISKTDDGYYYITYLLNSTIKKSSSSSLRSFSIDGAVNLPYDVLKDVSHGIK